MLIVKYLLHMSMDNLILINKHFLDHQNCMELIGKYIGTKKEWIISEHNWYRDQAFEVIRLFHIQECYIDNPGSTLVHFEKIKKSAAEYLHFETRRILTTIDKGMKHIVNIKFFQKQERSTSTSIWTEITKSYEADHNIFYNINIRPVLYWSAKKINAMAGYDAIGMRTIFSLAMIKFVTEVMKAC